MIGKWSYIKAITEASNDARIKKLEAAPNFHTIIRDVVEQSDVLCGRWEASKGTPNSYRAVFTIQVSEDLFDLFFNSQHGYRGQYFTSIENGKNKNRVFIQSIKGKLVEETEIKKTKVINSPTWLNKTMAEKSLSSENAKAWAAETGFGLPEEFCCKGCKGEWSGLYSALHISNNRWTHYDGSKPHNPNPRPIIRHNSNDMRRAGCQAPKATKIRILGGFINQQGQDWRAPSKNNRALEIHEHGFT